MTTSQFPVLDRDSDAAHGCGADGTQDLTGQPLSRAPMWSAWSARLMSMKYTDDYKLALTGDVRYSSGYYLETSDNPYAYQGKYATLDLSARIYNGDWEFALIGQNLTNTYYGGLAGDKPLSPVDPNVPGKPYSGGGSDILASLGRPREVTLQITRHF